MKLVKVGSYNGQTTYFANFVCPYCHCETKWDTFYTDVDKYETLSSDASVINEFVCPVCKGKTRVCLDVLVHAEKTTDAQLVYFELENDTLTIGGNGVITKEFTKDIPIKPKKIVIKEGITSIGTAAFCDSDFIEEIELPKGIVDIDDFAFAKCCLLKEISIPEGVLRIGKNAFLDCVSLIKVNIPDSVTKIEKAAFESCSKLTIVVPKTVTHIAKDAFSDCHSVTYL